MNGMARLPACLAGVVLAGSLIGCGGALVAADGGGGSGGGGSAGGGPGGTGGAAEGYDWPGAIISVAPTSAVAENMIVVVEDQAIPPALSGMLTFPPTTTPQPTDGAGVAATYTCGSPGLVEIQLVTCADQVRPDRVARAPGCLVAVFTPQGTMGNFIHPSGATCDITAAKASIQLPPPVRSPPVDGGPPPDAAVGTFEFNCQGGDGTHLFLGGHFLLPVSTWQLAC